jgi:hypothetical protein
MTYLSRQAKFDILAESALTATYTMNTPCTLAIFETEDEPILVSITGQTSEERAMQIYQAGSFSKIKNLDVDFVVMITESWMVAVEKGQKINCAPSKHPDRQDVLMLAAKTRLGDSAVRIYIKKDGEFRLAPDKSHDFGSGAGDSFKGITDDFFEGYAS